MASKISHRTRMKFCRYSVQLHSQTHVTEQRWDNGSRALLAQRPRDSAWQSHSTHSSTTKIGHVKHQLFRKIVWFTEVRSLFTHLYGLRHSCPHIHDTYIWHAWCGPQLPTCRPLFTREQTTTYCHGWYHSTGSFQRRQYVANFGSTNTHSSKWVR